MFFSVLAITPERPDEEALTTLLWPWCHSNPDLVYPRWDFFRVGDRFTALLDPHWTEDDPDSVWDTVQKQKRDLDIPALQARAVAHEADFYDRVQIALTGLRLPDLAQLQQRYGERGWVPHWHADPAVKAVRSVTGMLSPESILSYNDPRDVALAKARRHALLTSAIVQGGQWYDADLFDWYEDPARTEEWASLSERLIANAAPDDWLTVVDCHC